MFWTRKSDSAHDRARVVGLDLNATRARAVSLAVGRSRTLPLEDPAEELPLVLSLERRTPVVGAAAIPLVRKLPHLVCSNFLPQLGEERAWHAGRVTQTPESAISATFDKLRDPVVAETDALAMAVPAYLSAGQVRTVAALAAKAKLPLRGTVAAPLAVVAHRAAWLLDSQDEPTPDDGARPDWIVPIPHPATVVVVDVDEFALTAAVVAVEPIAVRLVASAVWPRASLKLWKDRLLDAMSDRCVRLCRRDPRDSAEAEQGLYEQLDDALDRTRLGQSVRLAIRGAHWYQDLHHQPDDFDAFCAPLARHAADGLRELLRSARLPIPPRGVWLTDAAARLPGLAAALHQQTPEQTEVLALPPNAVADAAAVLVPFWLTALLPRLHLDAVIPLGQGQPAWGQGQAAIAPPARLSPE